MNASTPDTSETTLADFVPQAKIPELYPNVFPAKSWPWMVQRREHNGLAKAFKKTGNRLLVNTRTLAKCLDELSG